MNEAGSWPWGGTKLSIVSTWLHPVLRVLPFQPQLPVAVSPKQFLRGLTLELGAFLLPELVQFLFGDNILTCTAQLFAASETTFSVFILGILPPTERPAMVGILWTRTCACSKRRSGS